MRASRHAPPLRGPSVGHPPPGIPRSTWVISTLSLGVLAAAGVVFFSAAPRGKPAHQGVELTVDAAPSPPPSLAPPFNQGPELTKSALDLTPQLLDARRRVLSWSSSAVLLSMEAIVTGDDELEELSLKYGRAVGPSGYAAPVDDERMVLTWSARGFETKELGEKSEQRGLLEPGCPLAVAVRRLRDTKWIAPGRLGMLFSHSRKFDRAVWTATATDGTTHFLDAESCALLLR